MMFVMMIKLIVGLANLGSKYAATRHNAGSWYVNLLALKYNLSLKKSSRFNGYLGQLAICNNNIRLLVPNTYMNFSGKVVAAITSFYQLYPEEILIAHDELDLLPGDIRLKFGGSHGGHNGVKDIIYRLGNNANFHRLRIGIGHPGDKTKVINFVLSKPSIIEQQRIDGIILEVINCVDMMITKNIIHTTNKLNYHSQ